MTKKTINRRRQSWGLPSIPTPRLILLPDNLDPSGDPRPALALGRAIVIFASASAALAAKQAMEAGR